MPTLLKINNPHEKAPKVLIAPLDWGLGHATRCIPIIKELINQKCEVCIAASGAQKALLQVEFPFLSFIEFPGYGINYGKNRAFTILKIICAIPKILIRIKGENHWLRQYALREKPDAIVSDNRYGLYISGIPTVLITHQLGIKTGLGTVPDALLRKINYRYISRFTNCWVPDLEKDGGLAGSLSHPPVLPVMRTRYVGVLSRFEGSAGLSPGSSCDLLIMLSGPEPQRTLLEEILLTQLSGFNGRTILVRGLPSGGGRLLTSGATVTIYDHLPSKTLNEIIMGAGIIVTRAGYSTVMDLVRLQKKAILIPTPGQTEQEYLGAWLQTKRFALCAGQSGFSLHTALVAADDFPFVTIDGGNDDLLHGAIKELLGATASST